MARASICVGNARLPEMLGRQRAGMRGEHADAAARAVQGMDERDLDKAGHEHRDGNGAGHGLLKQGHEAAASGDGFDPVPLKFAGGVDEQRFELRRGAGQDFFGPDAAQDPADNGEIEGKGISELPRRFWEQRIKAEDADWGVVVQVTAGYPHSALPWALAPDEGPDDLS